MSLYWLYLKGVALEKLLDFFEWPFEKKDKSTTEKITELDKKLQKNYHLSFLDILENPITKVEKQLAKIDRSTLDEVILLFFEITTTNSKKSSLQQLKKKETNNRRILDLIHYTEKKHERLSSELHNIKNSVQQMIQFSNQSK